jgi:hypothetical protein
MYLILNSGTRWDADGSTPFPNEFRVDSVRAYQLPATSVNDATLGTKLNQFNYTGKWDYSNGQTGAFFNDNHWSSTANDTYSVSFNGRRVDLYGAKDPAHGIAAVSIDAGPETKVDFYAATRADKEWVWSSGFLNSGNHVVKVRVTGTRNAASKGVVVPADRIDVWPDSHGLNGTVLGTTGSWNNQGNTRDKAFNGNLNDFFDSPTADGAWVGLDLGTNSPSVVTHIRFCPRTGFASRMLGGVFQGANHADFSDAVELYRIATAPNEETFNLVSLNAYGRYRFLRYLAPTSSNGNIAELEFVPADSAVFALTTEDSVDAVSLTWSKISGATDYVVWRSKSQSGAFSQISRTSALSVRDTSLPSESSSYYFVTTKLADGTVRASDVVGPAIAHVPPRLEWLDSNSETTVVLRWPEWIGSNALKYATNLGSPIQWLPMPPSTTVRLSQGFWYGDVSTTNRTGLFFRTGP